MTLDLVIRNAKLAGAGQHGSMVDIGVKDGVIVAVQPKLESQGREHDARGKLVTPGLVESHFHLENGANCTIATNNVLNAFTPYGNCSLTRIANLYANVVQRYGPQDLDVCFEMITDRAAKLMRVDDYGIEPGKSADLVVWDEERASDVIAKCALPLAGFRRGRQIFSRERPLLMRAR